MTISNFLKDFGTLILAIYGIVQLWLVGIWKWWFCKARIEMYTADTIEVGYSNLGPTLGLYGTIASFHRDSFINNISLKVIRQKDKAEYRFDWIAFRSNQFVFGANQQLSFELPSGFIVTSTQPYRYNILFSDRQRWLEMLPATRIIEKGWSDQVNTALSSSLTPNYTQLFDAFARSREAVDFHTRIQRYCYWEQGEYSMIISIRTSNPKREFLFKRDFALAEQDAERLRLNAIVMFTETCRQPNIVYNFVYSTLNSDR